MLGKWGERNDGVYFLRKGGKDLHVQNERAQMSILNKGGGRPVCAQRDQKAGSET